MLELNAVLQQALTHDSTRGAWSDQMVRDTIAAIAHEAAYRRDLTQSLWDRGFRWVFDRISDFLNFMTQVKYGREITIGVIALVGVLIVTRLVLSLKDERVRRRGGAQSATRKRDTVMLSDAERLAAAGDYTAAAHALFQALIAASASRGEVRVHPSKTAGDYGRELQRRNVSWMRTFQSFRVRYDRVIYGDNVCTASDYAALERDVKQALTGRAA